MVAGQAVGRHPQNDQSSEEYRVPIGGGGFSLSRVIMKKVGVENPTPPSTPMTNMMLGIQGYRGILFVVLDIPVPIVDATSNDTRAVAILMTKTSGGDTIYGFGLDPITGVPVQVEILDDELLAVGEWISVKKDLTYLKPLTANEVVEIQNKQASLLAQRRNEEQRRQMTYQGFTAPISIQLYQFIRDVLPTASAMTEYLSKAGNERVLAMVLQSNKIVQMLRTSKHFRDILYVPDISDPMHFHVVLEQLTAVINTCPNKAELAKVLEQHPEFVEALTEIDLYRILSQYVKGYKDSRRETFTAEQLMAQLLGSPEGKKMLQAYADTITTYNGRGQPRRASSVRDTPTGGGSKYPTVRTRLKEAGIPAPEDVHERLDKQMGVGDTPVAGPETSMEPIEAEVPGEGLSPMGQAVEEEGLPLVGEQEPPMTEFPEEDVEEPPQEGDQYGSDEPGPLDDGLGPMGPGAGELSPPGGQGQELGFGEPPTEGEHEPGFLQPGGSIPLEPKKRPKRKEKRGSSPGDEDEGE